MSQIPHVLEHYEPHVEHARAWALDHPSLGTLLSDELDADTQLGFLIEFSALGVRLLRPAEDSLQRAADLSREARLDALGDELHKRSTDAAERRLLLVDDLVQLAELWRERKGERGRLDLRALVHRPPPAAGRRHAALRQGARDLPLASIGVELELGWLATGFNPKLMRACEGKLGAKVFRGLSYLQTRTEQAALGADRLLECLDDLLWIMPDLGRSIALAGVEALHAHIEVLGACIERGRAWTHAQHQPAKSALQSQA